MSKPNFLSSKAADKPAIPPPIIPTLIPLHPPGGNMVVISFGGLSSSIKLS